MERGGRKTEFGRSLPSAERVAREVSLLERWRLLLGDKEVHGAAAAGARTLANGGIILTEMVPGIGEVFSWGADAWKFFARATGLNKLDLLTPDVSLKWALISEIPDLAMGTLLPSHLVEFTLQLRADAPRIRKGIERAKAIFGAEREGYRANKEEIDSAMEDFGIESPLLRG